MSGSHKTECQSYAVCVAEQQEPVAEPARVEQVATELLSDGTVTCICSELPS